MNSIFQSTFYSRYIIIFEKIFLFAYEVVIL